MIHSGDDKGSPGIITSRKCPACGHHEIGYISSDGTFHSLRPGDRVQVFETGILDEIPETQKKDLENIIGIGTEVKEELLAWVPEPVKVDRTLSMKYGVLLDKEISSSEMTIQIYEKAYLEKLRGLIEKETSTPLPVILDRFLSAPNLASGDPKQIAQALFDELDEIREPVKRIREWLEKKDNESLERMIHPRPLEVLNCTSLSDDEIKDGIEGLALEDFLEMI